MSTLIQIASAVANTGDANRLIFNVKYDEAISKGDAVYVSGADGTNILVKKADYTTEATSSKTLGLALVSGPLNFQGQVIAYGLLSGIDTSAASGPGDSVWLGAAGGKIYGLANKPYAPLHLVSLGVVTKKNPSTGEIFVKTQNGFELDEIHDVQLKGTGNVPTDGQVLTYEGLTGLWKAKSIVNEPDSPLIFVMAATEGILVNNPVYYNGPANDGIGATLTSTTPATVSDTTAVGRIDTNYIPELGDLILVKNQVDQRQNGVYEITQVGSAVQNYILTRSTDVDAPAELYPLQINAFQGLVNGSKYFTQTNTLWGDAVPPVIGGAAPNANIIFALTSLTTAPLQITFVDHVTVAALPTCTYTVGPDVTKPGVGATLIATAAGLLTLSGMSAASTTGALNTFNTLLVRNQAEPRHNGTYQVINPGSATARWVLQRIDTLAAGFNKALRIVFCSHNVSPFAGSYYTPTWNPTLLNKNVGVTVGIPTVATNRIDYVGFAPQNGRFGIANSNGAYTYYSTLQSAINAAVGGQTVEVFADFTETTNTTVTLKLGVNIQGNGHTYTLSGNGTASALSDNGATASCKINNFHVVRTSTTAYSTLDKTAIAFTGNGIYDLSGSTFQGTSALAVLVNGPVKVSNITAFGSTASQVIVSSSGAIVSNVFAYNTTNAAASYTGCIVNGGTMLNAVAHHTGGNPAINNSGKAVACRGFASGAGVEGFYNQGVAQDCHGHSSGGIGFTCFIASTSENCSGYSAATHGISINGGSGARLLNCSGASAGGAGINAYNGFLQGCNALSSATFGIQVTNGNDGFASVLNCTSITSAGSALYVTTQNSILISNNTLISQLAGATGHGIFIGVVVQHTIVGNTIQVASSSAFGITATAVTNTKYSQNRFIGANIPVSSNIVQTIVNTEDAYGNITI
jgi:hypothetical protein